MGKKYLIMLDVDQTLLDINYRSTSPTINSVISQMQDEGHVFILNSNRSLQDLQEVAKVFNTHGELIGENGAFIYDQATGSSEVLLPEKELTDIKKMIEAIPDLLAKNFSNSKLIVDDSTNLNKNTDILEEFGQSGKFFILNKYRKYSVSLHAKELNEHLVSMCLSDARLLFEIAKQYIAENDLNLLPQYTESYCNLLVTVAGVNKSKAFNRLAENYPKYRKIIIADDYDDKNLVAEMDHFFAVNNADESAKQMSDYVASENITKGVEQILLKLDDLTK